MSFGAISAESQRDIIEAMSLIGGRSNSGEGGENPYYLTHGIHASVNRWRVPALVWRLNIWLPVTRFRLK